MDQDLINSPFTPSRLTFGMDMIFRQNVMVDWALLKKLQRNQTAINNGKENKKRRSHEYKIGDLVLIVQANYESSKKSKLSSIRSINGGSSRILISVRPLTTSASSSMETVAGRG